MKQYLNLLKHVKAHGVPKNDRTGVGTLSVFGYQIRFNLEEGFPVITTKKIHLPSVIHELLWFLKGESNIRYLKEQGVSIWDEWADEKGELGPIYGVEWRAWPTKDGKTIDQIRSVVEEIQQNPNSRRLMVSAWNVGEIEKMALPPCHCLFQFYVIENRLSCQLYQRSADAFLGVPFNITSYALLTHMVAHVTGLKAAEFVHTFGDVHLYNNHLKQVELQLSRETYPLPSLRLNPNVRSIFDFQYSDIEILNYQHHPAIRAPVAV